jgi:hypothetical protein
VAQVEGFDARVYQALELFSKGHGVVLKREFRTSGQRDAAQLSLIASGWVASQPL